jgi:hypothetical protein
MRPLLASLEQELEATRVLVEAQGRKVLIVGIATDHHQNGLSGGLISRSVSAGISRKDARIFVAGLEREIARLKKLLGEPA